MFFGKTDAKINACIKKQGMFLVKNYAQVSFADRLAAQARGILTGLPGFCSRFCLVFGQFVPQQMFFFYIQNCQP